ncbi:hypothetical protein EVAR_23860_1 [Eumeta japonica]|uniref:Uncharacterized protein n=1 Tax=Eumeta variegata TaxID=151549 RepID=A0A4C1V5B4_EUMVA|nr:hypothetical protein EVAR_23860_1 [Eumeta japonica]
MGRRKGGGGWKASHKKAVYPCGRAVILSFTYNWTGGRCKCAARLSYSTTNLPQAASRQFYYTEKYGLIYFDGLLTDIRGRENIRSDVHGVGHNLASPKSETLESEPSTTNREQLPLIMMTTGITDINLLRVGRGGGGSARAGIERVNSKSKDSSARERGQGIGSLLRFGIARERSVVTRKEGQERGERRLQRHSARARDAISLNASTFYGGLA